MTAPTPQTPSSHPGVGVLEVMYRAWTRSMCHEPEDVRREMFEARAAVAELIAAAQSVMAKHDADAVRCNFSRCGCDYCASLRSALSTVKGDTK